ncbi:MAG: sulfite exporter TauE/SafE family protein [Oceanospirillales bacterium]|nr:sulfite exporter TauE/SafE family protein [Oceanospirillales bacterium]
MLNEVLLGVGVGVALGLTGSGGVLAVPALMLGLGFSLPEAMPVALIAVGLSSFLGSVHGLRQGIVRYRAAIVMALFGILCAPIGIALSHQLPTGLLTLIFSLLLLWVALRMARQALQTRPSNCGGLLNHNCMLRPETGRFNWNPRCFVTLSSIGGLSGLCSGMLGVGGGFLIVPGVRQFSNLQMHAIVATSLAVITLISTGTVINALLAGARISDQAWWFIAATALGLLAGRLIAPTLPAKALQLTFSLLACVASLMLINRYLLPLIWS